MPSFGNLLILTVIASLAPLLLGLAPRLRIPSVVLEIAVGVIVGPSVLGLVRIDQTVQIIALLGMAFLLFLAGLEVDPHHLSGPLLRMALIGYVVSLAIGVAAGSGFGAVGWVRDPMLMAVALSATSLGLVVPVLKDAGRADQAMGQTTITASFVAVFASVVLLSLLFSVSGGSTGGRLVSLIIFVALVIAFVIAVVLAGRSMRLGKLFLRLQDTTAEIRVRAAVVLLVTLVVLAEGFGLESILGAFLAGAVVGFVDRDSATHPHFRTKLEAIGYGFLIPVFFVASGVQLDLREVIATPPALLRVPLFLLTLLLVRGLPALLYQHSLGTRSSVAAGLLQATSLPLLVVATQIGVPLGLMTRVTATALICAGLLSVLLFPAAALALLRKPVSNKRREGTAETT